MFSTFKGGIHPPENKKVTEEMEFSNLPIPQVCYIPLQQHIGAPAKCTVSEGDMVEEGQLIGIGEGFITANVHASIPGKVREIVDCFTVYNNQKTVVIEAEGAFSASAKPKEPLEWNNLSRNDIIKKIQEAGIVGLGGAAFPTHVKLSPPSDKNIDTLIVNGAECEPYLTVDDMLMKDFAKEILMGTRITLKALGIKHAIIGIEDNKKGALRSFKEALSEVDFSETVKVKKLKTKYPQGAEKQLIYSILRRTVPSGALPMDIGVVVQNVGTIFSIREAVLFGKPLFERYITVSGKMINKPGNYKVRIGTRVSDIVEECGGLKGDPAKVVIGGPMCGLSIPSLDMPVVKGTSGILFLSEEEVNIDGYLPCIRCGKCVSVCPVGLLPCELGDAIENNRIEEAEKFNPFDCVMCGSCAYTCPARRPLSHFIKLAQDRLRDK
ncbi:electron transport complex subunit RsxC [Spirochaetota bacterium]